MSKKRIIEEIHQNSISEKEQLKREIIDCIRSKARLLNDKDKIEVLKSIIREYSTD